MHMVGGFKGLERAGCLALAGVKKDPIGVGEQAFVADVGGIGRARADHELTGLVAQHLSGGHIGRNDPQAHPGCLFPQAVQQLGQ